MTTKRVNLTINPDNPMDSLIIELLGGEDYLTSKNIKALLLQMAINNGTFITQKRNVYDIDKKQDSNFKITKKKLKSDNKVTNEKQESVNSGTNDFDLDNIITYEEPLKKDENKVLTDQDIYKSMLNFM